jgi:hypothetical protein
MLVGQIRVWIELVAVLTIPLSVGLIFFERISSGRGLGARSIQFITVATIIPVILILGLEGILDKNVLGTIIGGLIGYLLSGVGNYQPEPKKAAPKPDKPVEQKP